MTHDPSHSRRARPALARLPEVDPAIAALALWCAHRDGSGPTATRDQTITYGPEFESHAIAVQIGVVAHHVLHVALRHSARKAEMAERLGPGFDGDLFALCADAIVNEALLEAGHALPRPAVRAQELLARVTGTAPSGSALLAEWDTVRLFLAVSGRSGSGGEADRQMAQRYAADRGFRPDLDAGAPDDTSAKDWSVRVEAAVEAGRAAGSGIGPVLTHLADLPDARIPWERRLRRLLARATSEVPRQSHRRPARSWIAREALARAAGTPVPVFEPGRVRDRLRPRIAVGLDTSSSITETQLSLFGAEARSVARRSGAEVHLLAFDTEVHAQMRLTDPGGLNRLVFRRGGGTGFAPVIAAAARLDPSILVVLTDLDGPAGPAPDFPVIWAVPKPAVAPFGSVLVMDG